MRLFVQKALVKSGLVSIILPTYNTDELFLRQAVDSVVAQTYDNWELLIIDDSTTSPVENIINSYSDQRIKYFRNPQNLGMANSRNRGLDLAQGEFIALLDHDDIWMPEKLSEQLKVMQQYNCNMVYSSVTYLGSDKENSPDIHNIDFISLLKGHSIISCSCVMLRTTLVREFNLKFSPQAVPADDYAMWMTIALYGENIECTDQYLVRYRIHNNNVSGTPLACYPSYEWIYKDITSRLLKTRKPWWYKLKCIITILRSRSWVLRQLANYDKKARFKTKLLYTLKAIILNPVHPQNWLLLAKLLCGR